MHAFQSSETCLVYKCGHNNLRHLVCEVNLKEEEEENGRNKYG